MGKNEADKVLTTTGNAESVALLAKIGISVASIAVGAPGLDIVAAGLIDAFRPAWTKRQTDFAASIVERLATLEIDVQKLAYESDQFVTVFSQAAREAVATHEAEKIEALRNAVVNTAAGIDIENDTQLLLIQIATQLTAMHIRTLVAFQSERQISMGAGVLERLKAEMQHVEPNLRTSVAITIIHDLQQRGLVEGGATPSALGIAFLKYVMHQEPQQ